jgi:hypothetical protein
LIHSAFEEATRRDPQHQREWVVLVDGSLQQLEAMKAAAQKNKVSLTIVLDFIHVLEYLWKAAHCFFTPGNNEAEPWVMQRALRLLQGKVSDVAAGIRRSATLQKLSKSARENVDKCADYLLKYRQHLQYDQFLSKGFPIESLRGLVGIWSKTAWILRGQDGDLTELKLSCKSVPSEVVAILNNTGISKKCKEFTRNHIDKFLNPDILISA